MSAIITGNKKTVLMGILNITPDSFFDGGEYYNNTEKTVKRAEQMVEEGADIIDIGGESTRPGSEQVSIQEELRRVIPVIKAIKEKLGNKVMLSIDTNKSAVAKEALQEGCNLVNNLGGFLFDKKLAQVVAEYHCPIIMYHIKGEPKTMQTGEIHYNDVIEKISKFFDEQIAYGKSKGIKQEQFILDPGIGFGKTVEQNIEIIKRLKELQKFTLPIAIGVSRKSHLGKLLQTALHLEEVPPPSERLEASLAETAIAVLHGANIIRTHDIAETKRFVSIIDKFKNDYD